MAEYIDRKTLMKIFRVNCKLSHGIPKQIYCKVIKMIKQLPVVDAEEVIRCKNCKYGTDVCCAGDFIFCKKHQIGMTENDFCSCAENKVMENTDDTVDDEKVKYGEWVHTSSDSAGKIFNCSVCGYVEVTAVFENSPLDNNCNYCTRCGAKMDGKKGDGG